jgi:guanine deaminase
MANSAFTDDPNRQIRSRGSKVRRSMEKLPAMDPSQLMQIAIDKCRQGLAAGQSPFGCAIARNGELLSASHNTVVLSTDITAHAEVNAVREACQHVGGIFLDGAIVATTCEPCPMCMAALHWARVEAVYFGATIADAATAGFNELQLPAAELLRIGGSQLKLIPGVLQQECKQLIADWYSDPSRKVY